MHPTIANLFLDRDGVVIHDAHYLSDPAGVRLLPGVGESLARLCAAGVRLFLVTNQSGIGRGFFTEKDFGRCQTRLAELLAAHGAHLAGETHCPHAPAAAESAGCDCRKPATGMWLQLRDAHGLDPAACAMVGDKRSDIGFGRNAGFALTALVATGKGADQAATLGLAPLERPCRTLDATGDLPDLYARDLPAAIDCIFGDAP